MIIPSHRPCFNVFLAKILWALEFWMVKVVVLYNIYVNPFCSIHVFQMSFKLGHVSYKKKKSHVLYKSRWVGVVLQITIKIWYVSLLKKKKKKKDLASLHIFD